nr:hypothetical protein CFP56_32478 [Quercus suber]
MWHSHDATIRIPDFRGYLRHVMHRIRVYAVLVTCCDSAFMPGHHPMGARDMIWEVDGACGPTWTTDRHAMMTPDAARVWAGAYERQWKLIDPISRRSTARRSRIASSTTSRARQVCDPERKHHQWLASSHYYT